MGVRRNLPGGFFAFRRDGSGWARARHQQR
jgi:hypothetical protein